MKYVQYNILYYEGMILGLRAANQRGVHHENRGKENDPRVKKIIMKTRIVSGPSLAILRFPRDVRNVSRNFYCERDTVVHTGRAFGVFSTPRGKTFERDGNGPFFHELTSRRRPVTGFPR